MTAPTIPTGVFSFTYQPCAGPCAGCGGSLEPVHVMVEDKPYCGSCLAASGEILFAPDLLNPANAWHYYLEAMPETMRPGLLYDMQRFVAEIGEHLVPEGTGEDMDDASFAAELISRATRARLDPERTHTVLAALVPDLTGDQLRHLAARRKQAATIHAARLESEEPLADCAMIVLTRGEGPTLEEACDQLSINFDQFLGVATTKAAEHGVPVRDLPLDVIDECLTAARDDRPASLRKALREHLAHCRANGLDPKDPEVFKRYADNLPADAKDYLVHKVLEDRIEAAYAAAVKQGHAVRVGDGVWETVPGHDDAVKDLLGDALAGELDDEQDEPETT